MDHKKLAQTLLEDVGGAENVEKVAHCVTRLRLNLKDDTKADTDAIRNLKGISGVVNQGGQYQIIIGQEVTSVYNEFVKLGKFSASTEPVPVQEKKKLSLNTILDTIAGIFLPIMPIIAGAGMIKALLSILKVMGWVDVNGMEYYFLTFIADTAYYFLPVYLGASAAKKFGCSVPMGAMLGAMLIHPSFTALADTSEWVTVFGLPVKVCTYSSSVIPIILIVWVLKYVERFVERVVPTVIKFVGRPLLTLVIMCPLAFCVLGPLGSFLGDGLVTILLAVDGVAPWILPTVIGAFMPYLVMTGMHYSLLPVYVSELSMFGHETVIGPGNLPSNVAQGAAALAVAFKTKNKEFRELAISGGVTALIGVTEPVLYGVHMRLKKTLIAVSVGGGLGGLYAGITGVQRFGGGGAGLAALGLYIGDDPMNLINAIISCVIAFAVSFTLVMVMGFDDVEDAESDGSTTADGAPVPLVPANADRAFAAPVQGEVVSLGQTKDEAFSSGALGQGVAIVPANGHIVSPVSGKVVMAYQTGHAYGIQADNGAEVLIHIGIDTVNLGGKGFTPHVKVGDQVEKGTPLADVDLKVIDDAGYDPTVMMVVSNCDVVGDVEQSHAGPAETGTEVMRLA